MAEEEGLRKGKVESEEAEPKGAGRIWRREVTAAHKESHTRAQTNSDFTPRLKCQQGKLEMSNSFRV